MALDCWHPGFGSPHGTLSLPRLTEEALKQVFKEQKRALETKEKKLKAKIKEARQAGDATRVDVLQKEFNEVKAQKELLEQNEDKQEEDLDAQEERIEKEMNAKDFINGHPDFLGSKLE